MTRRTMSICSKLLCSILITLMVFLLVPADGTYALTNKEKTDSSVVSTIETGSQAANNYFCISSDGTALSVEVTLPADYEGLSPRMIDFYNDSNSYGTKYYRDEDYSKGSSISFDYDCSDLDDGTYLFRLCAIKSSEEANGFTTYPSIIPGIKVVITNGVPEIHQYTNMCSSNCELTESTTFETYLSKALTDYKNYAFRPAGGGTPRSISEKTEADYYKTLSDKICAGLSSDYEKALAIFTYVADNFYYDYNSLYTKRKAYDDPYYNLKYLQDGTGNNYNAKAGKVALQCDGYAMVYTALVRAQNIPARVVYGHKITLGKECWEQLPESDREKNSHTWVQLLVNGNVVNVDPQQGSVNTYGNRTSSDTSWKHSDIIKYCYFDISMDLLSSTHCFNEILPGGTGLEYLTDEKEISQLKSFLTSNSNGKKINASFSSTDRRTWSKNDNAYTDGYGRLKNINWPSLKLKGTLDLSNFASLNSVYVSNNNISKLKVSGCSDLKTLKAASNNITTFDSSTCKNVKTLSLAKNNLTSLKFYANKAVRTFTATEGGSFSFDYDSSKASSCTIISTPDIGYKYSGVYNSSTGKKLSSNQTYKFKATAAKKYKVKFVLDPYSYKNYPFSMLKQGNSSSLAPYNLAVQKRLKSLGYYTGSLNGKYTAKVTTAVKAFQKKNGLKVTGSVKSDTWKKLFSTKAKKK